MRSSARALTFVVVLMLLAACGSSSTAESLAATAGAPVSVASASEAPSPSASSSASGGVMPLAKGPLQPGRYTSTRFEPQLELTLGSGWAEQFPDDNDELALDHDGGFLAITRVSSVVDPSGSGTTDAPDDLFAWLTAHGALTVEHTEDVTVAGLPGQMLEATVAKTAEMFAYPTGNMRVVEGDRVRYYVVPLDGPDLTIVVASQGTRFEDLIAAVEPVVDSLEIVE